MITFQKGNTIFITEGDNDHFLVIIIFGPSLKSNDHQMSHYSLITGPFPSDHYLRHYRPLPAK